MRTHPAHSLLELSFALVIMGVVMTAAARPLHRARQEVAVHAARRELTATVALARSSAILGSGARLIIDVPAATAWVETGSGVVPGSVRDLGHLYGVRLASDRGSRVELRFDALGVGRLANATLIVRRGGAEDRVIVSAYGRVRS